MKIKTFVVTLVILLALATTACGRITVMIDDLGLITGPTAFGRLTTLAQVVAAVGADDLTVIVNREITAITQNVPGNLQLDLRQAGTLNVGAGQTVTFVDGTPQVLISDKQHAFTGLGAVVFTTGGSVRPDWWEYNTPGVTDMSVALQAAVDSITVGGGDIYYLGETYIIELVQIYGNINHHGVNGATILRRSDVVDPAPFTYIMHVNGFAPGVIAVADNEKNILIEDITFHGNSDTLGFVESHHSLGLLAASDVTVQRCKFIFPQGDSIFLHTRFLGLHNERINILYNYFDHWDGGQNGGRNAISVVDGVDILIKGNYIYRTGFAGMPGGIDVEADGFITDRFQNITIENNWFKNNTKSGIQIVLNEADTYTLYPTGFKVINNHFDSTNTFANLIIAVRFFNAGAPYLVTAADASHGVVIENNYANDSGGYLSINGTKGTILRGNTLYGNSVVVLGDYESITGENNYDLTVDNNIIEESGNVDGCVLIGSIDFLKFTNNIIREPSIGLGIRFLGVGVTTNSSNVTSSGDSITGTVAQAIDVSSHTLTPETNRFFGNTFEDGALNDFLYDSPDDNMAWGDYDFTVDTGAIASYVLGYIPINARITRAWYQVIIAPVGAGASISIGVLADAIAGIKAEQVTGHADYLVGYHDGIPDGAAANFTTQTTAGRAVVFNIVNAVLTAGEVRVWWEYVVGE